MGGCERPLVEDRDSVRLVSVTDGDTIRVVWRGENEPVRYIGIDTPERGDCGYEAATRANERLVEAGGLQLVFDAERRDRHGRLLAYVYAGGRFVNVELAREGFAQQLTVPPNVAHARAIRQAVREAREADRGLWKSC